MIKRDYKTDVQNLMYKNSDEISSLIPYLYEGVHYALDLNADPLLRAYIVSSIIAYLERKNDIPFEEILASRNLSDLSDQKSRSQVEVVRYVIIEEAYATSQIIKNYNNWNFNDKETNLARHLFMLSMQRLYTSFKATVSLLNSGFFVEVVPLFRLILEQLAWGSYLLSEPDDTKIKNNRVQSDIGYLKTVLNDARFGEIYGYFSSGAHLEPREIGKYLKINEEEDSVWVKDRSGQECEAVTEDLLLLLDAYGKVVWAGMEYFGFPEVERGYFEDWYGVHVLLVGNLKGVLEGKANLVRVD